MLEKKGNCSLGQQQHPAPPPTANDQRNSELPEERGCKSCSTSPCNIRPDHAPYASDSEIILGKGGASPPFDCDDEDGAVGGPNNNRCSASFDSDFEDGLYSSESSEGKGKGKEDKGGSDNADIGEGNDNQQEQQGLFDMEVSPTGISDIMPSAARDLSSPVGVDLERPNFFSYEDDNLPSTLPSSTSTLATNTPTASKRSKGRRVHYDDINDYPKPRKQPQQEEELKDLQDLETILLAPPLDMEVQLSPPDPDLDLDPSVFQLPAKKSKKEGEEDKSKALVLCGENATSPRRRTNNNNDGDSNGSNGSGDFEVSYVVPDGGWGWWVLLGSIIVNILIPGTVKSFGILFVEFLEVFDASPAAAAWIPALSYWLYSSMGPFAGALATKYSHRSVTIAGGLLASAGLMLSYFATSIPYLYVSYGIIGGLGAGLAYPIGVFIVGEYFEKRRGLANGLCTSGSALGSVLVPPLLRVLLNEHGYRGAILIMGAILLNVCVGAMFYDPVVKHMKRVLVLKQRPRSPDDNEEEETTTVLTLRIKDQPQRQVSSPIPRLLPAPSTGKEMIAASMPIAIPLPPPRDTNMSVSRRAGSGNKFPEDGEDSWSFKSNEVASPLAARLVKDADTVTAGSNTSSPKWSFHLNRGAGKLTSNNSNPELESLMTSNAMQIPGAPNNQQLGPTSTSTSRGQSRLNLTAIPEKDDDEEMDDTPLSQSAQSQSRPGTVDWQYYSTLTPAKQRLLRLSLTGAPGGTGITSAHPSANALLNGSYHGSAIPRTMSIASNVSNSSFRYVSTIHHGSLLSAMQLDKNLPEFASTLTLQTVKASCCPRLSTIKAFVSILTCGLIWGKKSNEDEGDNDGIMMKDLKQKQAPRRSLCSALTNCIDLSLLKDGMYLIMLLSNSTSAVGYTNFIILLPSYALALGFDKSEAAMLLSIVAALDFVGRIGGAAMSDLQLVSRRWYYIIGLFFSGIALAFLPQARTFTGLATMCGAFGLASGTYIGVTAVILADQLGAEKLGSSYGLSLFLNGLLQLAGPPICGALLEETGELEPILCGLGVILIVGATLWIFAPFIERRRFVQEQEEGGSISSGVNPFPIHHHNDNVTRANNRSNLV